MKQGKTVIEGIILKTNLFVSAYINLTQLQRTVSLLETQYVLLADDVEFSGKQGKM